MPKLTSRLSLPDVLAGRALSVTELVLLWWPAPCSWSCVTCLLPAGWLAAFLPSVAPAGRVRAGRCPEGLLRRLALDAERPKATPPGPVLRRCCRLLLVLSCPPDWGATCMLGLHWAAAELESVPLWERCEIAKLWWCPEGALLAASRGLLRALLACCGIRLRLGGPLPLKAAGQPASRPLFCWSPPPKLAVYA